MGPPFTTVLGTKIFRLEVAAPSQVRLVSDLHLRLSEGDKIQAFANLLAEGDSSDLLCILGDLFDYWVGPRQIRQRGWREIIALLRQSSDAGRRLYFLHGNRDYQLDRAFERATGGVVVPGGLLLERASWESLLCLHGDELCLNDLPYQRIKKRLRSMPLKLLLASLPFAVTQGLADQARKKSRKVLGKADSSSLLPSKRAIDELGDHDFTAVCFGHIHRPGNAVIEHANGSIRYWVLPAFEAHGPGFATWDGTQLQLRSEAEDLPWPGAVELGP